MGGNRVAPNFIKDGSNNTQITIDDATGIEAAIGDGNIPVEETITEQAMSLGSDALKFVTEAPEAIRKAYTGEDVQVEYNFPELTDIPSDEAGFLETFVPNIKLMFARNDFSKAEIIKDSFEGDKRFGGVHKDKFDNPIIVWNNQPYYINKAGMSVQDFGTVGGDVVKYTPAGKAVGLTSSVGGKVLTGLPAYFGTEVASQNIEEILAPETAQNIDKRNTKDKMIEATQMSALGTGLDVVVPPVLKGLGKTITSTAKGTTNIAKAAGANIPNITNFLNKSKNVNNKSKYELTQGQRQNPIFDPQKGQMFGQKSEMLDTEDYIRYATGGKLQGEKDIVQAFDAKQLSEIQVDARILQKDMGTNDITVGTESVIIPLKASENIKGILTKESDRLKQSADDAYDYVDKANRKPTISKDGVINFRNKLLETIKKENIDKVDLPDYKFITKQIKYLNDLGKKINKEDYIGESFELLNNARQRLNRQIDTVINTDKYQASVLIKLKENVDEVLFDNFDKGFVSGDKYVIEQLKKATKDYSDYMKLGGQQRGSKYNSDKHANKILEKILDPNLTPKDVLNVFFGHNKFAPPSTMKLVLQKIKSVVPDEQYQAIIKNVKDTILEKAFTGDGKKGITRSAIAFNYKDVFIDNKDLIANIFSKNELNKIKQFKDNVMPTLWAEIRNNPSGSGYVVPLALAKSGLLGKILDFVPFGKTVAGPAIDQIGSMQSLNIARDITEQFIVNKTKPLFNFPIPKLGVKVLEGDKQGLATSSKEALIDQPELDTSSIKNIANNLNPSVKKKILEAVR